MVLCSGPPELFSMDSSPYSGYGESPPPPPPPPIFEEFKENGHWVVSKTMNRFSAMPIDQCHEQNNEIVKGSGGAVGLTENPSAFQKWMLAGPEQARLLQEFEKETVGEETRKHFHHEENLSTQQTFKQQTLSLVNTIKEFGNPFLHDTQELVILDKDVVGESVVNTVRNIEDIGRDQYHAYRQSVLVDRTKSIHEPITRNRLPLFRTTEKPKTRQADKMRTLKADVDLFSRLYIVAQQRESDISTFFMYENHPYPPSISDRGRLRFGTKSDLLTCIQQKKETASVPESEELDDFDLVSSLEEADELAEMIDLQPEVFSSIVETTNRTEPPSIFDVKILDGTAVLHFLQTAGMSTFGEYAEKIFIPYLRNQLDCAKRVDIVWDTYKKDSIKETTRERRGKGIHRKVEAQNKIPGKWQDFLRDPENKKELFAFLTREIEIGEFPADKEVVVTSGEEALCRGSDHQILQCDHEEADTRMVFHLHDALKDGHTTCLIRTVDTDVAVILLGKYYQFSMICPDVDIWVAFGVGKKFNYIHINTLAAFAQGGSETSLCNIRISKHTYINLMSS